MSRKYSPYLESILDMIQEFKNVQPIDAAVQQGVHALESRLPQVQPIVHLVTPVLANSAQ
jgi:hypothetical protein